MTQPISPTDLDELRRLAHFDWADGAVDGGPPLADTDRAAKLFSLAPSRASPEWSASRNASGASL